jgi:alkanesulfonate monooxygenase SsuD/methylene tetrahydromethanopterin reductase-like flavin-dependent oxidoreductase (luciferase family)
MESEHSVFGIKLPEIRARFSLLFETLAYIHAVVGRSDGGYLGRHFKLEDIDVLPRPLSKLPIIVGGMGKKRTPSIAGRFSDEYNLFATTPDELAARLEVMRSSAADIGRDPDEVKVSLTSSALIGADEAEYREVLGAAAAKRNKDPEELEATLAARRLLHGTYEQAAELVTQYANEGVGRIYIQHFSSLADIDAGDLERQLKALTA